MGEEGGGKREEVWCEVGDGAVVGRSGFGVSKWSERRERLVVGGWCVGGGRWPECGWKMLEVASMEAMEKERKENSKWVNGSIGELIGGLMGLLDHNWLIMGMMTSLWVFGVLSYL